MEEMKDVEVSALVHTFKYAHIEREKRFLLRNLPATTEGNRKLRIFDKYLEGTRLRLRKVIESGQPNVFKLGQKIRIQESSAYEIAHTTIYLNSSEFELFAKLPGSELEKVRTTTKIEDLAFALDVFQGRLNGLVLAEIDVGGFGELPRGFRIANSIEVTEDERFTGGALAKTGAEQLRLALEEVFGRP